MRCGLGFGLLLLSTATAAEQTLFSVDVPRILKLAADAAYTRYDFLTDGDLQREPALFHITCEAGSLSTSNQMPPDNCIAQISFAVQSSAQEQAVEQRADGNCVQTRTYQRISVQVDAEGRTQVFYGQASSGGSVECPDEMFDSPP